MDAAKGSIRQRGSDSFELRVYGGTDPSSGRRRWLTRTVRGDRSDGCENSRRWRRTPTSRRRTGLAPPSLHSSISGSREVGQLGLRPPSAISHRSSSATSSPVLVGDLTTAIVDGFYEDLRGAGRIDGKPLAVGTVRRIHSALHAALAQAQRWSWVFENVADQATPLRDEPAEMRPPNSPCSYPAERAASLNRLSEVVRPAFLGKNMPVTLGLWWRSRQRRRLNAGRRASKDTRASWPRSSSRPLRCGGQNDQVPTPDYPFKFGNRRLGWH
jgi:hypothetical protein